MINKKILHIVSESLGIRTRMYLHSQCFRENMIFSVTWIEVEYLENGGSFQLVHTYLKTLFLSDPYFSSYSENILDSFLFHTQNAICFAFELFGRHYT